jgi:hypothetical protein
MLRSASFLLLAIAFVACNEFSKNKADGVYGKAFDTANAVSVSQVIAQTPKAAVVKGVVKTSCKTEGCWLKLDAGNGGDMFVSTEEKFAVPLTGMEGKTVYVQGETYNDTTSVEDLREQAKADGKSESDVENITQPKIDVSIRATGVKVL